ISVAEAIRRSSGKVAINGLIVGMSSVTQAIKETEFECSSCGQSDTEVYNPPLFSQPRSFSSNNKRKCVFCNLIGYGPKRNTEVSAMIIQLQDEEKQNELENLNVVLYDTNTLNVRNGEKVMVAGELHVVQQSSGRSTRRITYLFANLIEYETSQNDSTVLTEQDILEVEEFAKQPDMISKLVDMFAPTVIGHEDKKLGTILMYVGAPETQDFRGRIHGLFIGPPGTAKSKLARAAYRLGQPYSRYSSAQGASGKGLTAIIDKDNDSYVLRNGVLPQAKNSLCVLNEIASLSMEDQRHLFDVMEEGKLTLDKYGFHKEIDSPTTVLATTNPEHGEWYMDTVDKGQIPLRKELVDRYDLPFVFEPLRERKDKLSYAKQKLAILKDDIKEDHALLRNVIEHAKTFRPILSEEAEAMITDFWSSLNILVFPTNRVLDTIIRISFAFARLHFSNIVTAEIAKEAIQFLTNIYNAFDRNVAIVQDPREATCHEIAKFLQEIPNMPFEFQACINHAARKNSLVETYLGESPIDNNSSKYRDIADRFKQGLVGNGLISIVNMNPLTLVFNASVKENNSKNVL
ncbi:MAG: AAA family ATPase, partial [Nitrososphaeraceae archaeon]